MNRASASLSLLAVSALALAGCASTPTADGDSGGSDDGKVQVVATTNVYGSIVEEIGGDHVEVTSLITSAAQDPHEYEPSSKDKLIVNQAELIVTNGAGYDAFVDGLITNDDVPVIEAVDFAADYPGDDDHDHEEEGHDHEDEADAHDDEGDDHDHEEEAGHEGHNHIEGFNEHVWYDPAVISALAADVAEHLSEIDPDNAADYEKNAAALTADLDALSAEIATTAESLPHVHVLATEPIALRLTDLLGAHNVTPEAFLEAVEEGQDVAPAVLLETLNLIADDDIALVIANLQTGGNETERVVNDAEAAGITVLEFSEVLPDGLTYLEWMRGNLTSLTTALNSAS